MNEHVVARKVLEYLTKENITPTPVTLSIWFLYFRGDNKTFISRMKSLLSTGKPISEESYNKLYETYVLKAYFKDSLGINRTTSQIIERANDLKSKISDFADLIRTHQSSIGDMRGSLAIAETKEAIEVILSEAMLQLKVIESESVETTLLVEKGTEELNQAKQEVVEIEQSMNRDFLTGLPDYSFFQKTLEQMLTDSLSGVVTKRYFIVFDIQDLEFYNKQISWLVGDSIIRLMVKMIQEMTDEKWQVMRLQDDEIAIIPPEGYPVHELPEYIQKIQSAVRSKKLKVKSRDEDIKNVELNAAIIKVVVYDDMNSIDQKIRKGLNLIKEDGKHTKIVKVDD
ncbi:MAG: GGDEF domain-containing protein [Hydrogenovibrio sp.]|nr:GGDEF domain-containing protein [Hydrogenovibrio sp.]